MKPQFLTIQKFIKLLSPFHLEEFKKHLQEVKAATPLKLIEAVTESLTAALSPDDLCMVVYGKNDEQTRKSFNQLASHTLRLSSFLSRNYPNYLIHNISRIEELINDGDREKANILADCLLDMAERIGDYHSQILCLKFLAQQAQMYKSHSESLRLFGKIQQLLEVEVRINELYTYSRKNLNISVKDDSVLKSFDKHQAYFKSFHNHENITLSLLSRYFNFFLTYYYRPTEFLTEKLQKELRTFDEDLQKNQLIVFPFMEDIFSKFLFFKLNLSTTDLSSKEGKAEYQKLLTHNKFLKFWQNYVNIPELYAIAIKSTYYLSRYHSINHRSDFLQIMPAEDRQDIVKLIARCEQLVKLDIWEPDHVNDLIHFKLTWSALLLLGEKDEIKKGVDNLEKLMTTYQQITFSESMDSIFICLMLGYFALGNYKMCVETFKRYVKLSKGRVVNTENDLEIHTYYYVAQWLSTERKQYLNKLRENYLSAEQHNSKVIIQQTILEMISYFDIPVSLN
ncbi:MAG: hypothetical protein R2850_06980 [Bacteroidia bacterium]